MQVARENYLKASLVKLIPLCKTYFHLVELNSTGVEVFLKKMVVFMSKSIYNKPKAGKMRIKMRSRIHVVLVRVSEFHPLR